MSDTRFAFLFRSLRRKLWVRAVGYAVLGVALVPLARLIGPQLPSAWVEATGAVAVRGLLGILASSMLAVTTFSLSIMVSAYSGATAAVTPRAVKLLLEDRTAQTVLSTFIGAFLFSIVGIIGIEASAFSDSGLLVLFFATIAVTALVVIALIHWIHHLTTFGRVADTTDRVERAAAKALRERARQPALGGIATRHETAPPNWRALCIPETGYLCHIDMPHLSEIIRTSTKGQSRPMIQLAILPGVFLHPEKTALWVHPDIPDSRDSDLCSAFTVDTTRSFDQDPRFGICVLSEIAERALSPAVNDPGTAIDVLGRAVRLLSIWAEEKAEDPSHQQILVPELPISDLFDDIFPAISHDGAGKFSVQMRLQKCLLMLAEISPADFGPEAVRQSNRALKDARSSDLHEDQIEALVAVNDAISKTVGTPDRSPRRF
ncbi:DUF2254 domain-containing protein [Thioclava sp. FR2]|uniref:DUF2254 domain-containing protein n=1 Tax=Thioclava sp. FR2 TaxID=3445780 RepID=UPI003EB786E6